jgi:D-beta-D-heptose 7-phosphate kinase / D-beta-D-heptose 1-phosphate adenosyltransferase
VNSLLNKSPKILVIGDLIIDHYLWGSSDRISPEAPVPVVKISSESIKLGGAGNVVSNLKALGSEVDIFSVIGKCQNSIELKLLLEKIEVSTKNLVVEENRVVSRKNRIISAQQQVARYDQETSNDINNNSQKIILSNLEKIISNYKCILLSDYGKGVLTDLLTKKIIKLANKNSIKVLVDPKGIDYSKYKDSYLLTPNKYEAGNETKINIGNQASLLKAQMKLKDKYNLKNSLITLSEDGISIYDGKLRNYPTLAREVFDVTGAGDTVLASLGFAIACDMNIDDSVVFANLAAGVAVSRIGSASVSLYEMIEYESNLKKVSSDTNIKDLNELSKITAKHSNNGKKIVFTNGCFDILHIGHVKYLEKAKKYGDILIVGINSDDSVKLLKGPNRPINNQNDRAHIIGALDVVDYVVIFNDETPYNTIKKLKPKILVKGGDYKNKTIVGSSLVDEVKIVDFLKGKSTTQIIKNLKQ